MVVYTNIDRPGMIGFIGTLLGQNKINIAAMQVGRKASGGEARHCSVCARQQIKKLFTKLLQPLFRGAQLSLVLLNLLVDEALRVFHLLATTARRVFGTHG